MAVTYTYDVTAPAGSDSPRSGDDEIRTLKLGLHERLNVDHDFTQTGNTVDVGINGGSADLGKHRQVTFVSVIDTPTPADNDKGILYSKTASSKGELHWIDEDSNEIQLTSAGVLNITAAAIAYDLMVSVPIEKRRKQGIRQRLKIHRISRIGETGFRSF